MYYIYHIPTFVYKDGSIGKIGCTRQKPKKRVEDQGYSSFEILEEHSCIDRASDREIELQKQYGYKVDKVPYHLSSKMFEKATDYWRGMIDKGFFKEWYKKGNQATQKGVVMLDKHTQEPIKEFDSIADALRSIGKWKPNVGASAISACCRGKRNSIYGYKWKYKD